MAPSDRRDVEGPVLDLPAPDAKRLALRIQIKTLFGLRSREVGVIYEIRSVSLIGHIVDANALGLF